MFAYDAAYPATGATYRQHDGIAANVYVSGTYAQDAAHVRELRAEGIAPWPNYERTLWELVSNRVAGQRAGREGISDAIRCGFPADGTIWFPFSVDVSVAPTQYGQVAEAFRGIQDVNDGRFLISCYGQGGLIKYLRDHSVIDQKGWLSASSSFPGYDRDSPDICIYQEVGNFIPGHSTDRNVITDVHSLHAWWPDNSPYGDDMAASPAEIADAVWERISTTSAGGRQAAEDRLIAVQHNVGVILTLLKAKADDTGGVDVPALAAALADELGPDLGAELVAALGTALTQKAG